MLIATKGREGLKNKAFTLIELLAVIIILGVIALIVYPIIMGTIERSKKASFARSIDGLIESTRIDHSDDSFIASREYFYEKRDLTLLTVQEETQDEDVKIEGRIDGNGFIYIDDDRNISVDICMDDYYVKGPEDDIVITDNPDGTCKTIGKEDLVISLMGDEVVYSASNNDKTVSVTRTVVVLDMTPIITITEPNTGYVKSQDVLITVTATKPNHISEFTYEVLKDGTSIKKETIQGLTKSLSFTETGIYEVIVSVTDNNDHSNRVSKTYKTDTTAPSIAFSNVQLKITEVNGYDLMMGVTTSDNSGIVSRVDKSGALSATLGTQTNCI